MPLKNDKQLAEAVRAYLSEKDNYPGPDDISVNSAVCPNMPLDDFIAAMVRIRDAGGPVEFEAIEWKGRTRLRNFSSGTDGGVLDANLSSFISKI